MVKNYSKILILFVCGAALLGGCSKPEVESRLATQIMVDNEWIALDEKAVEWVVGIDCAYSKEHQIASGSKWIDRRGTKKDLPSEEAEAKIQDLLSEAQALIWQEECRGWDASKEK